MIFSGRELVFLGETTDVPGILTKSCVELTESICNSDGSGGEEWFVIHVRDAASRTGLFFL